MSLRTHWESHTMHQNLAIILQQFNYSKNSFIVLIPGQGQFGSRPMRGTQWIGSKMIYALGIGRAPRLESVLCTFACAYYFLPHPISFLSSADADDDWLFRLR